MYEPPERTYRIVDVRPWAVGSRQSAVGVIARHRDRLAYRQSASRNWLINRFSYVLTTGNWQLATGNFWCTFFHIVYPNAIDKPRWHRYT